FSDAASRILRFVHRSTKAGPIKFLKEEDEMTPMKKTAFFMLLMTALILAGCAGESPGEEETSEEGTKISFIHWRGEDKAVFDDLIAQFEDEFPDIQVEMNIYPSEQYQATGQRMLADGSTGDVFTSF